MGDHTEYSGDAEKRGAKAAEMPNKQIKHSLWNTISGNVKLN